MSNTLLHHQQETPQSTTAAAIPTYQQGTMIIFDFLFCFLEEHND